MISRLSAALPLALVLGLAACGGPKPQAPSAEAAPQSPIDRAIALLDQGDEEGARKALKPLLKRDADNPEAAVLTASIDQDPVALLGPKSFTYKTQAGDTVLGLSEKFLGTRLKFYELARYNGIKVPSQLEAGTTLKIPGEPPRPAASAEPAPAPKPAAPRVRKPKSQPAATPAPAAAVAPKAAAADPAAGLRLRSAALVALNQGKADQAVAMLRHAAVLAPGNALIARDLARAERIAQTVHAQH